MLFASNSSDTEACDRSVKHHHLLGVLDDIRPEQAVAEAACHSRKRLTPTLGNTCCKLQRPAAILSVKQGEVRAKSQQLKSSQAYMGHLMS